jgi:hypothetical protein
MAYDNTGLMIAICVLIGMILVCHTMNFLYPHNNRNNRNSNGFGDIPLPTQYNIISYDNELGKIPCDSQAQLPCKVLQQQQTQCATPTSTQSKLSDSEIALLYKEAYERAGEEILIRTLQEMQ